MTVYLIHFRKRYRHAGHYRGNPESSRVLKVRRAGCCGEFAGLTARMRTAGGGGWPSHPRMGAVWALGADRAHEPGRAAVVVPDRATGTAGRVRPRTASGRSGSPDRDRRDRRHALQATASMTPARHRDHAGCAVCHVAPGWRPGDRAAGAGPWRRQGPPARCPGGRRARHGILADGPSADTGVTGQPARYPNHDDPGQRVYLTLRITQAKGGRR